MLTKILTCPSRTHRSSKEMIQTTIIWCARNSEGVLLQTHRTLSDCLERLQKCPRCPPKQVASKEIRTGKMAQPGEVPAAKTDHLSSIPRTDLHDGRRDLTPESCLRTTTCVPWGHVHVCTHTYMRTLNKYMNKYIFKRERLGKGCSYQG